MRCEDKEHNDQQKTKNYELLQKSLEAGSPLSSAVVFTDPAGVRGGRGEECGAAAGAGEGAPDLRGHRAEQRGRRSPAPGLQATHGVRSSRSQRQP